MDMKPKLSFAGTWVPVQDARFLSSKYNGQLANVFHAIVSLDGTQQYGMVVTGWGYSGWPPALDATAPVSIGLFSPDGTGGLKLSTGSYIDDPVTSGGGSVIIADFNDDGRSDIFLAAHNESPFIAMPSTAYMSNRTGGFSKLTVSDNIIAHDAELAYIGGRPTVFTATFSSVDGKPYAQNAIFSFGGGAFSSYTPPNIKLLGGMAVAFVDDKTMLRGDVGSVWNGVSWTYQFINSYEFDGTDITSFKPVQSIVPYLSTLPQFKDFPATIGGVGATHTYRLWADDLNHDGKQDILAGESMWSQEFPNFPSALQVLLNNGDGTLRDETARLNPDMDLMISEMDYAPTFIDLDHSGIKTYLFAGSTSWADPTRQSDYVLLNDGTGRLYVALHSEFSALAKSIFDFLGMWFGSNSTPPRFIGIPQLDGSLNFIAEVPTNVFNDSAKVNTFAEAYVNVPLHYNPATDFTQDVSVTDRNQSMLMRTWAGNDTFYDANANPTASRIDGGLGRNTSVYSGAIKYYEVKVSELTLEVKYKGGSAPIVDDTLLNVQNLQFSDAALDTTTFTKTASLQRSQIDNLVELYIASFNRSPDALGLSYWGSQLKDGMTLAAIAKSFFEQPETKAKYPTSMASEGFVSAVYGNVLGRTPDGEGLQYWSGELANGHITRDKFILAILSGAHANPGAALDIANLNNKVTVGEHFALALGLNNGNWSQSVMAGVTSVAASVAAANAKADSFAAIAAAAETSEFVTKLLGIAS